MRAINDLLHAELVSKLLKVRLITTLGFQMNNKMDTLGRSLIEHVFGAL